MLQNSHKLLIILTEWNLHSKLDTNFTTKPCLAAENTLCPISDQISIDFQWAEIKLCSNFNKEKHSKKAKAEKNIYYI